MPNKFKTICFWRYQTNLIYNANDNANHNLAHGRLLNLSPNNSELRGWHKQKRNPPPPKKHQNIQQKSLQKKI